MNLLEVENMTSVLIFARTRAETARLASELSQRGFPAEAIHGDLDQNARERTLNRFRQNQVKVLVATDVAARGLDIDDISHVINYQLPDDPEVYIHRIGRTGRAGKTGIAISLFTPREKRRLREIENLTKQPLTRANLPTAEDIRHFREAQVVEQMKIWLGRGRYQREREMVEQLVTDGHELIEVAAAALKLARQSEKQRPVAAVAEVQESTHSFRSEREFTRGGKKEHSGPARFVCTRQFPHVARGGHDPLEDGEGQDAGRAPERCGRDNRLSGRYPRLDHRQDPHRGSVHVGRRARTVCR